MTPSEATDILNANFASWVRALSPTITEINAHHAVLEAPVTPDILRVGGIVSGQALATLADTSMVFACIGFFDKLEPVSTVTLDTQFLRPAVGDVIQAKATVTRAGRSMVFTQCTLTSMPDQKDVAFATATFAKA